MDNQAPVNTIFQRGANNGLWMGLYLSALFVAMASSIYNWEFGLLALVMVFGTPVLTYIFLRKSFIVAGCREPFSAVWMHGICIFFFGSLIMALASYVYLRFFNPSYMPDLVNMAIDYLRAEGSEAGRQNAAVLQKMLSSNMLPTPGQQAVQFIWLGVFSGSTLSLILTFFVRAFNHVKTS